MISEWDVYWLVKLDSFCTFFVVCAPILLVASIVLFFLSIESSELDEKKTRTLALTAFIFSLVLALARLVCPTTREMAVIKIAPRIVNSDLVQKDIPKESREMYDLFKAWLKEKAESRE